MRRKGKKKRLLRHFGTSSITVMPSADIATKSHGYESIPQSKAYFKSTHHHQIQLLKQFSIHLMF